MKTSRTTILDIVKVAPVFVIIFIIAMCCSCSASNIPRKHESEIKIVHRVKGVIWVTNGADTLKLDNPSNSDFLYARDIEQIKLLFK